MDILSILLAKALTPQGQIDTYAAKAQRAANNAAAAAQTLTNAASTQAAAEQALSDAQAALQALEGAGASVDMEEVDAEIKKLDVSVNQVTGTESNFAQLVTTYPDNSTSTENIIQMYKSTGNNEDGTMTQKAISEAIAAGGGNGSSAPTNLGANNKGHLVAVGNDGGLTVADATEASLVELLIRSGAYTARAAVGLEVNYEDKTFARIQNASGLSMGSDFDSYAMYGGRMRCNVAADGTINAFYGDTGYTDDGSNGQAMVYQPRFYYKRVPLKAQVGNRGKIIRHESIIISYEEQAGFKLHPLFKAANGDTLDYVLLPAYEGSISNNKLVSVGNGAKPISGLTIAQARSAAEANGTGWRLVNMEAESAQQMLEIIEFGSMNGQNALEAGISNINVTSGINCSSLTGSTASLGNATGHADSTINEINGNTNTYTDAGRRAISYRGVENPWGNIWHFVDGITIHGDGQSNGGQPHIYNASTNSYEGIGFNLPSVYGWISAMGYGNEAYDWVFMPAECSTSANSALPVGDNLWTISNMNKDTMVVAGGACGFTDNNGPFYYGCDRTSDETFSNYGAKLMFIPTKGEIYTANIAKWNTHMGG